MTLLEAQQYIDAHTLNAANDLARRWGQLECHLKIVTPGMVGNNMEQLVTGTSFEPVHIGTHTLYARSFGRNSGGELKISENATPITIGNGKRWNLVLPGDNTLGTVFGR